MIVQVIEAATAGDWDGFAKTYQRVTQDATVRPVQAILERLNHLRPFEDAIGILDNGSGPGTIMSRLIEEYGGRIPPSCALICADYSPAMVAQVHHNRQHALERDPESLWARVDGTILDALDLDSIPDGSLSHVAAGLVYNLTTNPQKCLTECRRVLEPNGVLAASAWEGNDWLEMMKVIAAVKPELRNAVSAKWITPQAMQTDLDQASFRDVQVQSVPITVFFDTYDKFVDTLLTFQPRMVSLLREFTQDQRITLRKLLLAEMKAYCPEEPGNLRGTVLVATGRK